MIYVLYIKFKDRFERVASSHDPSALMRLAKQARLNVFNHKIVCDHSTNKLFEGKTFRL